MTSASNFGRHSRRWCWAVPLAGFCTTYLLVPGVSVSNVDLRPQAEIAGLVLLATFPALGGGHGAPVRYCRAVDKRYTSLVLGRLLTQ